MLRGRKRILHTIIIAQSANAMGELPFRGHDEVTMRTGDGCEGHDVVNCSFTQTNQKENNTICAEQGP